MLHVYELPAQLFVRVVPLFEKTWFDEMFIMPALKGRDPGRVFVNQLEQPTAAILFRNYEFYIAGEVNPALRAFIKDAPAEPGTFQRFHGYTPLDKAWETALVEDSGDGLIPLPRLYFRWEGAPVMDWRAHIPEGASVAPITTELAQRLDQEWNEGIGTQWSGYDRFAKHGYGFCLMFGEQIGNVTYTDGTDERSASIGIRTNSAFRRMGLARLTCSAFIEATLARGLLPVWECEERNVASWRTAEQLGFVKQPGTFSDIIAPNYGPLKLSQALWQSAAGEEGSTVWTKKPEH